MQIKRTFQVQVSSKDCRETFLRFWNDFQDLDKFERGRDALVLVTLHGTKKLLTGFGGLLDCARNSTDESDFTSRLKTAGLVSNDTRDCAKAIRTILSGPGSTEPNDKDFWKFLNSVYLLSVDLTTSTAQNEGHIKDILALASTEQDQRKAAESTWLHLVGLASAAGMGAQTLTRQNLPDHLLSSHSAIDSVQAAIRVHRDHSQLILDNIRSDIGGAVALQRKELQARSLDALSNQRALLLTGAPGSGKSAVAKSIVLLGQDDFECMSFRAEEFAKNSIDDVLRGSITGIQLRAFLGAQRKALIHIESVERLLEQPIRDAFSELIGILEECENIHLLLTCRDYAAETVVNAFFRRGMVTPAILELPSLADSELDDVIREFPALEIPFSHPRIKDFLRNPFFLDIAARIDWFGEDDLPADVITFRDQLVESGSAAAYTMRDDFVTPLVSGSDLNI